MKKSIISQNGITLFAGMIVLFFSVFCFYGCEETQQTSTSDIFSNEEKVTLRTEALQIINIALSNENPQVRSNAIEIVAKTRNLNLMPRVQALLKDESVPVRFAAAVAVGDMQYYPARDTIKTLLNDSDANVILAASYAMTIFGYPYIEAVQFGLSDNNQSVKANSAMLLGKIGDKESITMLHQVMQAHDSDDMVAYQAAESLAMLKDNNIYPKLWAMLISAFADVRAVGIRSMAVLGTKEAQDAIKTMLDDQVIEVRLVAAEQLGELGNKTGQDVVLEVFSKKLTADLDAESTERVNVLAAMAIGSIGTKPLTSFLPDLLKNNSQFVRLAAAGAVFQCMGR